MKLLNHHRQFSLLSLLSILLLTVSAFTLLIPVANGRKGIDAAKGQTLYTQFSLFYERNCHQTTNYRKGIFLPVNSEVKFVKASNKRIIVSLSSGQELVILNVENFSGEKIDGIFSRTFATKPVDLSSFTNEEKQAILAGEVRKGMSKEAVIIALGYPPKHKTPSLEMNEWRYWQNRFGTFIVYFQNDRVTQIVD